MPWTIDLFVLSCWHLWVELRVKVKQLATLTKISVSDNRRCGQTAEDVETIRTMANANGLQFKLKKTPTEADGEDWVAIFIETHHNGPECGKVPLS